MKNFFFFVNIYFYLDTFNLYMYVFVNILYDFLLNLNDLTELKNYVSSI